MHFCYEDNPARFAGGSINYNTMKANEGYLRHYANYLYLDFIIANSDKMQERHQAAKELTKCEKKLDWWSKHANFESKVVLEGVAKLKKDWNMPNAKTPSI